MFLSTSERPFFWERGTYAVEVVAGVLAVEVAGAVLDVAIEHGGLLGARDKGEHCLCVVRWDSRKYTEILGCPRRGGSFPVLLYNHNVWWVIILHLKITPKYL